MGYLSFLAVGFGAFAGALLRWGFGILFNPLLPALPLGTLASNLLGGFVIGAALGVFNQFQSLPPEIRLFVTTGFCGGLTTFSTFSAEDRDLDAAPAIRLDGGDRQCPCHRVSADDLLAGIGRSASGVRDSAYLRPAATLRRIPHARIGEPHMRGSHLRLYTYENRRHDGALLYEWLLERAKKLGVHGGSAFRAIAGFGRHGQLA